MFVLRETLTPNGPGGMLAGVGRVCLNLSLNHSLVIPITPRMLGQLQSNPQQEEQWDDATKSGYTNHPHTGTPPPPPHLSSKTFQHNSISLTRSPSSRQHRHPDSLPLYRMEHSLSLSLSLPVTEL